MQLCFCLRLPPNCRTTVLALTDGAFWLLPRACTARIGSRSAVTQMWSHPSVSSSYILNVLTACLTLDPHRSLPLLYDEPSQFQQDLGIVVKMSGLAELCECQSLGSPAHVVAAEMFCTFCMRECAPPTCANNARSLHGITSARQRYTRALAHVYSPCVFALCNLIRICLTSWEDCH